MANRAPFVAHPIADIRLAERFSPEVISAWQASFFAWMPPDAAARLLASGVELRFAAGEHPHGSWHAGSGGSNEEYCAVVATGLLRIYARHQTRQVTLRYVGPGFVVGIPSIFAGTGGAHAQALTDCHVLRVRADLLRGLARTDARVAAVLCHVLATCVHENDELLSGNVFQPLRQRVARHLLDLADRDESGRIAVCASPQDIADATGTVREVVTRVIKRMREQGLVIREDRLYVLPDPAALHVVASGEESRSTDGYGGASPVASSVVTANASLPVGASH